LLQNALDGGRLQGRNIGFEPVQPKGKIINPLARVESPNDQPDHNKNRGSDDHEQHESNRIIHGNHSFWRNGVGFHVSLSCHKVIAASAHDANRKKFRSNQKNQYAASRPQLAVERAVLNGFRDVVAGGFLNGSVLKNDNFDFSCGLYVYKFSCFSLSNFLAGFRLLLIRLTAGVTRV
jgi:hypothetical protein